MVITYDNVVYAIFTYLLLGILIGSVCLTDKEDSDIVALIKFFLWPICLIIFIIRSILFGLDNLYRYFKN